MVWLNVILRLISQNLKTKNKLTKYEKSIFIIDCCFIDRRSNLC